MTRQELIDLCLRFADAYEDYPFDSPDTENAWAVMRHRGNKKGFAFIYSRSPVPQQPAALCVNLKCDPLTAEFLCAQYASVTPGYHMNKRHWITVYPGGDVSGEMLEGLIDDSWQLTKPAVHRKTGREGQ